MRQETNGSDRDLTKEDWPKFSVTRYTPNGSQFRIGTRDSYVDVPSRPIRLFIKWVHGYEEEMDNPKAAYGEIQEEIDEFNRNIRQSIQNLTGEECDWIHVSVRELSMANKPYNIQIRIKWDDLLEFLESVAESNETSLSQKYQYILACRNLQLVQETRGNHWISEDERAKVKIFAEEDIEGSKSILDQLEQRISTVSQKCREQEFIGLFYLYSQDIMSSFNYWEQSIQQGHITSIYRELRKAIEELTVALFYDIVTKKEESFDEPGFLPYPENDWFNKARDKRAVLRNLGDLESDFKPLTEDIAEFYDANTSNIWDSVVENLSASLFLAAASTDRKISNFEHLPDSSRVKENAIISIRKLLLDFKQSDGFSEEEMELAQTSVNKLLPSCEELQIKFPTGFFTRQFVSKYFAEDLNRIYDRYSLFSHAYPSTWQIAPASSILEYKILRRELEDFSMKANTILSQYEDMF